MTTYGNKNEPGIVTDVTSSAAVPTFGPAPNDLCIVGQADLANAENAADTTKVYQVTRASKAVEWFGPKESSLLTQAAIDALNEGAYPVYAVVAESNGHIDDISGAGSTTIQLDNAPIREGRDDVSVSVDGTDLRTNPVYDDVSTYTPAADECFFNPVRGTLELPSIPSDGDDGNDTVDYDSFDYHTAINTAVNEVADVIDFLAPISENTDVVDKANVEVANMEQNYDLSLCVGGADINLDPATFTQNYDDSRTQVVYPTRFEDNTSALASYAGFKANLGLAVTPINKRLSTNKDLSETLNRAERGSLISEDVVPLANESRGVRIVDDPTTVSDSNTDENNLAYGFNRLVADYIINTTRDNQKPFIGKLNNQVVRNTLNGMINDQLSELAESQVVISYDVNVLKEDATSVGVEMSIDLVEPLRYIENTVTIENGG